MFFIKILNFITLSRKYDRIDLSFPQSRQSAKPSPSRRNWDSPQPLTCRRQCLPPWFRAKFDTCTVVNINGTLVEAKMCSFTIESTPFIFNKCLIYTHDGASAKFSTNSHETDYSAHSLAREGVGESQFQREDI